MILLATFFVKVHSATKRPLLLILFATFFVKMSKSTNKIANYFVHFWPANSVHFTKNLDSDLLLKYFIAGSIHAFT